MEKEKMFCMFTGREVFKEDCREIWIRGSMLPTDPVSFDDEYILTPKWQEYPTWRLRENVELVRQKQIEKLNRP